MREVCYGNASLFVFALPGIDATPVVSDCHRCRICCGRLVPGFLEKLVRARCLGSRCLGDGEDSRDLDTWCRRGPPVAEPRLNPFPENVSTDLTFGVPLRTRLCSSGMIAAYFWRATRSHSVNLQVSKMASADNIVAGEAPWESRKRDIMGRSDFESRRACRAAHGTLHRYTCGGPTAREIDRALATAPQNWRLHPSSGSGIAVPSLPGSRHRNR